MTAPNYGTGRDVSCTTELRTGRYAMGARIVAEADYRRLTTTRGTLRGGEQERNYGLDLSGLVGTAHSSGRVSALPGQIKSELMKDERHESVTVTVFPTVDGPLVSYDITIEAVTADGPFTLSIRSTDVTTELLGIKADT